MIFISLRRIKKNLCSNGFSLKARQPWKTSPAVGNVKMISFLYKYWTSKKHNKFAKFQKQVIGRSEKLLELIYEIFLVLSWRRNSMSVFHPIIFHRSFSFWNKTSKVEISLLNFSQLPLFIFPQKPNYADNICIYILFKSD